MAVGIGFREVMSGGFAFGASEPQAGHDAGARAGHALTMHAAVDIDDLDRFVADPQHGGRLSGTLDIPGWGDGIAAPGGVFRLFSPAGEPDLKLMVYELAFTHDGRPHYLAGRKEVRDERGLDLWRDTTTLFTRLHGGMDKTAPVIGAGVLSLGIADLVRLLGTMRATGAEGAGEKAAAFARFGRMFLGELWDSYGLHAGRGG